MGKVRVLSVGLAESVQIEILSSHKDIECVSCPDKDSLMALMKQKSTDPFPVVLYGEEFRGLKPVEVAQTVRMLYPESVLLNIATKTEGFDRNLLMKNGFNEVYLIPIDHELLKKSLVKHFQDAETRIYSPVRVVDFGVGSKFNFELRVYLPRNNKFVPYVPEGENFDQEKLDRLKSHHLNSVYVPVQQLPKFYEYSAARLVELTGENSGMSETERRDKLKSSVRELTTGMLSESYSKNLKSGRKVIEHTQNIIDKFLILKHPGDWKKRLADEIGEKGDSYNHSMRTSTFAVLFTLALGQGNAQVVAMASMFHDLGIAELPAHLQKKPIEKMTTEEFEIYKTHPELSIKVLQARHTAISDAVMQAILFHHERSKGSLEKPKG